MNKGWGKDESGKKYNRLTVLEYAGNDKFGAYLWACICDCGKRATVRGNNLRKGLTKSCGCYKSDIKREAGRKNLREKNPAWKGGRIRLDKGYVGIKKPEHPSANNNGYIAEHRLIMENIVGRTLLPNETVHHKNGIKDDNREENLELWSKDHGYGARIEDKIKYAIEVLEAYAPYYKIIDTRKENE